MFGRAMFAFVIPLDGTQLPVDPGYGQPGFSPVDPGYGRPGFAPGHPGNALPGAPGHPGNALPTPPVRPSTPIVLPPGVWPPQLPPGTNLPDNTLPDPSQPIFIPPDPSLGIENPIVLPQLPHGVALLIALPQAAPKAGDPVNAKPAILVQAGKKPVLVYVSAGPAPKPAQS